MSKSSEAFENWDLDHAWDFVEEDSDGEIYVNQDKAERAWEAAVKWIIQQADEHSTIAYENDPAYASEGHADLMGFLYHLIAEEKK